MTAEWSFEYLRQEAETKRKRLLSAPSREASASELRRRHSSESKLPRFRWSRSDSHHYSYESSDEEDDWHSVASSISLDDEIDVQSFRAQYDGVIGKLVLSISGIRFVSSISKNTVWQLLYMDMTEMQKYAGSRLSTVATLGVLKGEQMEFRGVTGETYLLGAMRDRDQVFNEILGLSGRQWQALQTGRGKSVRKKERE